MKVDFTVKPEWTGGGAWDRAQVRINTKKGADACNEWYSTERRNGDSFYVSASSWKEFQMMCDSFHVSHTVD